MPPAWRPAARASAAHRGIAGRRHRMAPDAACGLGRATERALARAARGLGPGPLPGARVSAAHPGFGHRMAPDAACGLGRATERASSAQRGDWPRAVTRSPGKRSAPGIRTSHGPGCGLRPYPGYDHASAAQREDWPQAVTRSPGKRSAPGTPRAKPEGAADACGARRKPRLRGAFDLLHRGRGTRVARRATGLSPQANGSCRTMVWSRSGPVETMLIGQPASSSSARR